MRKYFFVLVLCLLTSVAFGEILSTQIVGPGVTHISMEEEGPLSIQVLKVDLTNPFLEFTMVLGNDDLTSLERPSSVSARTNRPKNWVVGAVNGDFWGGTQTPRGFSVHEGEIMVSPYYRSAFSINKAKNPFISVFSTDLKLVPENDPENSIRIEYLNHFSSEFSTPLYSSSWGNSPSRETPIQEVFFSFEDKPLSPNSSLALTVSVVKRGIGNSPIPSQNYCLQVKDSSPLAFFPGEKYSLVCDTSPEIEDWDSVVGGGPSIVRDGVPSIENTEERIQDSFATTKHPRTAVGYSEDEKSLILCVVDGRQPEHSIGVSLFELADIMIELGCYRATNLDGGGSSCMVVKNKVINSPSDSGGERATSNTFCIISKAPKNSLLWVF